MEEGKRCIEEVLGIAIRCSESLRWNTPGQLAFGRDMFLDIPVIADIVAINNNRQLLVNKRLLRENSKRIRHDYAVGDLVYKKNYIGLSDKLSKTLSGPYPITQCHTNGNVTIRLKPNLTEWINIRRVRPKFPLRK